MTSHSHNTAACPSSFRIYQGTKRTVTPLSAMCYHKTQCARSRLFGSHTSVSTPFHPNIFEVFPSSPNSMDVMESTWPQLQHLPPHLITLARFHIPESPIAFPLMPLIAFLLVSPCFSPMLCTFHGDQLKLPIGVPVCHAISTGWTTLLEILIDQFLNLCEHVFLCSVYQVMK